MTKNLEMKLSVSCLQSLVSKIIGKNMASDETAINTAILAYDVTNSNEVYTDLVSRIENQAKILEGIKAYNADDVPESILGEVKSSISKCANGDDFDNYIDEVVYENPNSDFVQTLNDVYKNIHSTSDGDLFVIFNEPENIVYICYLDYLL